MKLFPLIVSAALLFGNVLGGAGLIGYGQWWYDPQCCFACRAVIASAPLDCPDHGGMDDMDGGMDMTSGSPMAPCVAQNDAFLSTLAYCINSTCPAENVPSWKIEKYWADEATGDPVIPAKGTYGAILANITDAPDRVWESDQVLNFTARLSPDDLDFQRSFNELFDWEEYMQATYVIVIITVGVATPLAMSLLRYLPFMTGLLDRLRPFLMSSIIGTYNVRPLPWLLGNAPTIGQSLYITMFIILNVILSSVSYRSFGQPHPWGFSEAGELLAYVGYRTGHISFALLPLTVLFSSRNNFLLWLTDWPFSTFLVLHRWVARVCAIQAVVHSITLLAAYISTGAYYTDVHTPYWIWGIVATLCLVILLFHSMIWFRRSSYEVFLVLHILLTAFTIAGCWYHVMYWKGFTGMYEYWIYAVSAVWFFDRLVRVLRVCKNGIRRAKVTEISQDTVCVEVEGLRWSPEPGYHAYVYFPTLNPLRPWENHPFSITHTAMLRSQKHRLINPEGSSLSHHSSDENDIEKGSGKVDTSKTTAQAIVRSEPAGANGVTLFIKKHTGMTNYLRNHSRLPVMFDGPYRGNSSGGVLKCDRVLLIGGGIGITGLLTWIHAHVNVKLAWGVRTAAEPLVRHLATALDNVADKEVLIGKRLDVNALIAQEALAGWARVGVVVCGPPDLCDAVRDTVSRFGKQGKTVFELEVDAFSW